jgi:RNA polymerase sigma-70 factor, ECF subfamily
VAILLDNHRAFLSYLQRRVGSRALAEDILQDALVRSPEKVETLPDEALVPWFFRTLRNAIDHYRRQTTATRALEAFAKEISAVEEPPHEVLAGICSAREKDCANG